MKNICRIILSILLFIPSLVYSAQLANDAKLEAFDDFSGGLNTTVSPHKVPKNMATDISNLYVDEQPGSLVRIKGYEVIGSTTGLNKVNFMKQFISEDNQKYMFLSDSSRVLCTQDFINYIPIRSNLTTTEKINAAQGRGVMMFTNGVDPVFASSCTGNAEVLDGTNGSVNIPRGKYIEYYQDRFWIYNTTSNASALRFMSLTSTDGFVVNYNSIYAWPETNQLNISRGDGSVGSGLDVFKGQLYAHKSNKSIYTVFGTDEFTYFARKTNAHSGTVSDDSIVQNDNVAYYYTKDGVYAFDGGDSIRISDLIVPDVQAVVTNLTSIGSNIWDTTPQFVDGTQFSNTTTSVSGLVVKFEDAETSIVTKDSSLNTGSVAPSQSFSAYVTTLTQANNETPFSTVTFSNISGLNENGLYAIKSINYPYYFLTEVTGVSQIFAHIRNNRTGAIHKTQIAGSLLPTGAVHGELADTGIGQSTSNVFTKADFTPGVNSGVAVKYSFTFNGASDKVGVYLASATNSQSMSIVSANKGCYISNVATNTVLTYWDSFSSVDSQNTGSINYFYRTSTSAVPLSTATWYPINSGSVISSSSSYKYIQWAATITATSQDTYIDKVEIKHNEGGGSDTLPFSIERNGRIWIAVTTDTTVGNTIIYVKAKVTSPNPNAWTKINGINIKSWAKFGDNFYAGSSTAGVILKLDSGNTFNGTNIDFYYETPEVDMNDRWNEKSQVEYYIDVSQISSTTVSSSTLNLGISVDGSSFVNKYFSIDGTGRLLRTLKLNPTNDGIDNSGRFFKYRISNRGSIASPVKFHGFAVVYQNTQIRDRTR